MKQHTTELIRGEQGNRKSQVRALDGLKDLKLNEFG